MAKLMLVTVLALVMAVTPANTSVYALHTGPMCPSTVVTNSSIPKGHPTELFSTVPNATVCRAKCCENPGCVEWVMTTSYGMSEMSEVTDQGCVKGAPCCLIYNESGHHSKVGNVNVTSGLAQPWHLATANMFSSNMVLQRKPSTPSIYGLGVPMAEVIINMTDESSGSTTSTSAVTSMEGTWKAKLPSNGAGGNFSIFVSCPSCPNPTQVISMTNVTYGDLWICSGQSNAWLPLHHTFGLNDTLKSITNGAFMGPHGPRIRMFTVINRFPAPESPAYVLPAIKTSGKGMSGLPNVWNVPSADHPVNFTYGNCDSNVWAPYCFSALCWDFGASLLNKTDPDVPLGMISSNVGGTPIQAWSERNALLKNCNNVSSPGQNTSSFGNLYNGMIAPIANMSVKGFLWYQGENSIGRLPNGATSNSTGYACAASNLVKTWRSIFSVDPNSTDPEAPFGVVTLAAGTSEGHQGEMAAFRESQMGGYLHSPNPAMPGVFVAAGHDLGDPCYRGSNCSDTNYSQHYAHSYMGPIHPRFKRPPSERLATAASILYYGKNGTATGPVFAGCQLIGDKLTISFNQSLLNNDKLVLHNYNAAGNNSAMEVLVNQTGTAHSGRPIWDLAWINVNISASPLGPSTPQIQADLSHLNGCKPMAIRYAYGDNECCNYEMQHQLPCPIANCPLFGEPTGLPAMPFMAIITSSGTCECTAPGGMN